MLVERFHSPTKSLVASGDLPFMKGVSVEGPDLMSSVDSPHVRQES